MEQWKYHAEYLRFPWDTEKTAAQLNELGADDWELVTITSAGVAIFKRRVAS
jgi:hypothetical protein